MSSANASFKGSSRTVNEFNLPRQCIRNYFPSRKCFTFPFPTAPENVSRLESLDPSDLSPDFQEVTERFCKFVCDKSEVKKLKDGYTVTGRGDSTGFMKLCIYICNNCI